MCFGNHLNLFKLSLFLQSVTNIDKRNTAALKKEIEDGVTFYMTAFISHQLPVIVILQFPVNSHLEYAPRNFQDNWNQNYNSGIIGHLNVNYRYLMGTITKTI